MVVMQLKKLEKLGFAIIEVLADPDIDITLRRELRRVYDAVEAAICTMQAAKRPVEHPSDLA
jgi:hypothetical protein